jgi:hypothetical protein
VLAILAIAFLALCIRAGRHASLSQRVNLAIWVSAPISFHLFVHDLSVLIIPLSLQKNDRLGLAMKSSLLVGTAFTLLNWNIYLLAIIIMAAFSIVLCQFANRPWELRPLQNYRPTQV